MLDRSHRVAIAAALLTLAGCAASGPGFRADETPALAPARTTPAAPAAVTPRKRSDEPARLHDSDGRLSLAGALRTALETSPRIRAAREAAGAAAAREGHVAALPDPMVRLGWYAEPIETRTGPQRWSLAVQQAIPWPGALTATARVAEAGRRVAETRAAITTRDVLVDVARTYHELDYLHRARQTTTAITRALERLVAFAARGDDDGQARIPETVRAETWLVRTRNDALMLEELERTERARLRSLLGLSPDASIGTPRGIIAIPLNASVDALAARAEQGNHDLALAALEAEHAERDAERLATRSYPQLAIGGRYIATERRDDADPRGNGDDPLFLELGVSIPIWLGANGAAHREGASRARAAAHAHDAMRHRLRADIARAYWRAANAERLWHLHRDAFVPQAQRAAASAEALFDEGHASFTAVVETLAAWHQLELAMHRARADYLQTIAAIERLVGAPLARTGDDR